MQPETKGSSEFLKSTCPLIFEAFRADDKLLIGNGQGETVEYKQRLILGDGDVTTFE